MQKSSSFGDTVSKLLCKAPLYPLLTSELGVKHLWYNQETTKHGV